MIRKIKYTLVLLGIILCTNNGFAQKRIVDSLTKVLNNTTSDTARLRIYSALCNACDLPDNLKYGEPTIELADKLLTQITDKEERKAIILQKSAAVAVVAYFYSLNNNKTKALSYLDDNLKMAEKTGDKEEIACMLVQIGNFYFQLTILSKVLEYDLKALSIYQEISDSENIAPCVEVIGIIYMNQGNFKKALDYELMALDIAQKARAGKDISSYYSSVAEQYSRLGDTINFRKYEDKALAIEVVHKNKLGMANVLLETGDGYIDNKNYSKGSEYVLRSLPLWTELGEKSKIAYCLGRIAKIYRLLNDYHNALTYYFKALNIYREANLQYQENYSYLRIGQMYGYQLKNYTLSNIYIDSAIKGMGNDLGEISYLAEAYISLAYIDSLTGDYKSEAFNYKKYVFYHDSLKNIMNSQQTVNVETKFDLDQLQAKEKAEQAQKDIQAAADKRKETIIIWSVAGGLLLVLVFAGFIFRSLRITRRQKQHIEEKNKVIEEKNKSILDSITYAKRLQDAIIPPISLIKKYVPESFVLYKPKDIVAGDFYWMERSGDSLLIAAADCTGHGVPGALVSVVCSNALNRTVKEFHITEPGKILDKVRELVLETFEKSESNVQDGMDISLCCLNTKTNEIQWSGAYNSLWYIEKGEMKELPADKQPIGKVDKPQLFNTYNLNLKKGDMLYLFTDGYADQFGGPKGKKFKYKQMEELLFANAAKSMEEQKNILENTLNEWKGRLEQVDDILVIGIKV